MLKKFGKWLGASAILLGASVYVAWAAGFWPGLPIAGGASYCGGFGGTSGTTCTVTVPAGPNPAFTGAETLPLDTNLARGQQPQTVLARICQIGGGAYALVSPAVGSTSATIADNVCYWVMSGGAMAAMTVTMPANPIDGQLLNITCAATITALTLSANTTVTTTQAISNAPTACTVSTTGSYGYRFVYHNADTTWYRVE